MKINEEVKGILREFNISVDDGLSYLLCVYYDTVPSYVPDILVQKLNRTRIYEEESGSIKWNIPLFEDQITGFEWVKDWVNEFGNINKERKGNERTCIARMKKFFTENPDIRKDEVIGATQMYFYNLNDPQYLMTSHYFISKGKGLEKVSTLKDWIDKYRLSESQGRSSKSVTMK